MSTVVESILGRVSTPSGQKSKTMEQHRLSGTTKDARIDLRKQSEVEQVRARRHIPVQWPVMPDGMDEVEQRIWKDICTIRAEMGLLRPGDGYTIRGFIEAQRDYMRVREDFIRLGPVLEDGKSNPAYIRLPGYDTRRMKWMQELGLTITSQKKLMSIISTYGEQKVEVQVKPSDPFDDWEM